MTNELYELILGDLCHLRAGRERLETVARDIRLRVGQTEHTLAQHSTAFAHHSSRLDRIDERLSQIENRLELIDV